MTNYMVLNMNGGNEHKREGGGARIHWLFTILSRQIFVALLSHVPVCCHAITCVVKYTGF